MRNGRSKHQYENRSRGRKRPGAVVPIPIEPSPNGCRPSAFVEAWSPDVLPGTFPLLINEDITPSPSSSVPMVVSDKPAIRPLQFLSEHRRSMERVASYRMMRPALRGKSMSIGDAYFVVCSKLFLDLWTISRQTGTKKGDQRTL